jgi:hypothetical protein
MVKVNGEPTMHKGTQMSETSAGPTGASSAAARSGISRRRFLGTAAAAGLAAGTLSILGAETVMATRPGGVPIFFGSIESFFNQIKYGLDDNGIPEPGLITPVLGLNGVRKYATKPQSEETILPPSQWPAGPYAGYSGPIVYSIYPNPYDVLDTTKQAYSNVVSLIHSAPPNSYLNAWHEGLSLAHPTYINVDSLFLLHTALNELCRGTNVTYGAILSTTDSWDSAPHDLGFYGLDVYNNLGTGLTQLDGMISTARLWFTGEPYGFPPGTVPDYPNLIVTETNMPYDSDSPAARGQWFLDVCNRMKTYGTNAIGVLSYWHKVSKTDPDPGLSGPWLPFDQKTEGAMNTCVATF